MNRFVIAEPKLCIGCNTCLAGCTLVHKAAGLQSHPRLAIARNGNATAPVACRHCEDAPCAKVCPVNAITHGDDAIVLNEATCIGCKLCAIACPFGAITPAGTGVRGVATLSNNLTYASETARPATLDPMLAWSAGVRNVAVKCDLCAFQPERGPECVRVCPTKAIFLIDDDMIVGAGDAKRKATVAGDGAELLFAGIPSEAK